jgi:hypothetical protein
LRQDQAGCRFFRVLLALLTLSACSNYETDNFIDIQTAELLQAVLWENCELEQLLIRPDSAQ